MQDLAQRLYDEERFDDAVSVCRDRLARNPGDLNAMHLLALVHLRQGAATDAAVLLSAVATARPEAGVLNDLGTVGSERSSSQAGMANSPYRPRSSCAVGCAHPSPWVCSRSAWTRIGITRLG